MVQEQRIAGLAPLPAALGGELLDRLIVDDNLPASPLASVPRVGEPAFSDPGVDQTRGYAQPRGGLFHGHVSSRLPPPVNEFVHRTRRACRVILSVMSVDLRRRKVAANDWWEVKTDTPGYCESYTGYYVFSKKRTRSQ